MKRFRLGSMERRPPSRTAASEGAEPAGLQGASAQPFAARNACVTAALDTPIALARSAFDLCTPSVNNRCHSAARAPFTTRSLGV